MHVKARAHGINYKEEWIEKRCLVTPGLDFLNFDVALASKPQTRSFFEDQHLGFLPSYPSCVFCAFQVRSFSVPRSLSHLVLQEFQCWQKPSGQPPAAVEIFGLEGQVISNATSIYAFADAQNSEATLNND